jgi:hypothetical protein
VRRDAVEVTHVGEAMIGSRRVRVKRSAINSVDGQSRGTLNGTPFSSAGDVAS